MAARPFTCGIIVPVRDEVAILPHTVPALLAAARGEHARIIWVCNGCSDSSAPLIKRLAGPEAEVIELASPGKTLALQAGDDAFDAEDLFPRLYLDADTALGPGDLGRLFEPLRTGKADLVAATHAFELSGATSVSAAMARCWLALPFTRTAAMLGAVGISRAGRACWKTWPQITADDMFRAAVIPARRQLMVPDAIATTRPPATFSGWVEMRARWLRGERELRALGLRMRVVTEQRRELWSRLLNPGTFPGAFAFGLARLLAVPVASRRSDIAWRPNRTFDAGMLGSRATVI